MTATDTVRADASAPDVDLAAPAPADRSRTPGTRETSEAGPPARGVVGAGLVLAGCSASSGLIHAAMAPAHVAEWPAEGRAFAALAVAQLAVAAAVVLRPRRLVWLAAAAVQVPAIVGWTWSRTSGLPWGPTPDVAEELGWIDAASTAFEVAVVLLAVRLLLGTPDPTTSDPARRSGTGPVPAWAGIAGIVALAGAGYLIGSPSGQHTHGGAGHSHGAGTAVLAEPMAPEVRDAVTAELRQAREVAERYPTVADARAAGLQLAGNFMPGSAAHFVDISRGMADDFVLDKPLAWLYSGTDPDSVIVGVMYYEATETAPEGFTGPMDEWHQHTGACYRIEGDDIFVPFSPDHDGTRAECERYDGEFIEQTGWMVHAWVVPGWDSPAGVFSHDNPNVLCADGRTTVDDEVEGCVGT